MATEIIKNNENSEETYYIIRNSIIVAQNKVYTAVNTAMVQAYWEIGEQIYKACGDNDRSEYGKNLIKFYLINLLLNLVKVFRKLILKICVDFILCFQFDRHCLPN